MQMFRVPHAPITLHLCTVRKFNKLTDLTKLDFGETVLWSVTHMLWQDVPMCLSRKSHTTLSHPSVSSLTVCQENKPQGTPSFV